MKPSKKPETKKRQASHLPAAKAKPTSNQPMVIGIAMIAVVAFVTFSPCLFGNFLGWDDYNYIKDNPLIRAFSWDNIVHIFNYKTIVLGNYHPVTILSYVIEYQFAGLNPFLYHFDNLLLHLFNIILFAWIMWLLTKKTYATLIATALFAIHPMRVESVVWAAERKDVLYTFFFLLSLVFYIYFLLKKQRNTQYYLMSIAFFVLSILSKGQAVVLPLTLFLVDYWFSKEITVKSVLYKAPYFIFSLLSGILAIIAQHSSLTEQRMMAHSFFDRIAIAAFNVTAYLYKLVYPFNLSCFYKYPAKDDMGWVYAGALLAIVVVVVAAVYFKKNRVVVFGSLFFLFTLSIVSQILPVGNAIIADRYTYVPYIGLFFIIGYLLDSAITGKNKNSTYFLIATVAVLLVFSVKSFAQSRTWHANETLWENAISQDADNGVAYSNLGNEYIEQKKFDSAVDVLKKAILNERTYIECFNAYQNLGVAYTRKGMNTDAIHNFSIALSRWPGCTGALFCRGLTYTDIGRYDSAVADFTTIISKLDTLNTKSYYSRAIAYNKQGMPDRAIADYSSAIRIDPNYCEAYVNRGNIYFGHNSYEAAIADYNKAISISSNDGVTYLNRSVAYFKMERFREALNDAYKARELKAVVDPNYITAVKKAGNISE